MGKYFLESRSCSKTLLGLMGQYCQEDSPSETVDMSPTEAESDMSIGSDKIQRIAYLRIP